MRKPSMAALIEVMKSQSIHSPKITWSEFEDHVKKVYEFLWSLEGENVVVGRNVKLRGKTGAKYDIDVYYEFEKAGIRHRVAFECKNTKRPVERAIVGSFKSVVDQFPGMTAVMISAAGYQRGAQKFADENGILLLKLEDLPTISQLLGMVLEHVTMPDEKCVGAPFWTLFESETNAPYGIYQNGTPFSFLFFSKVHAQQFMRDHDLEKDWVVRGMSQAHFRSFILCVDALDGIFTITAPTIENDRVIWGSFEIPRDNLIEEYYVDPIPISAERNIMPSIREKKAMNEAKFRR